jgi:hypothetical protein
MHSLPKVVSRFWYNHFDGAVIKTTPLEEDGEKAGYEVETSTVEGWFLLELKNLSGNWKRKFPKNVLDPTSMIGH